MKTLTKEEFREKLLKDIRRRKEREKVSKRIVESYINDTKLKNWKRSMQYNRKFE